MNELTTPTRQLALELILYESRAHSTSESDARVIGLVFEKWRLYLSKLVGVDGYRALFNRALSLAKVEARSLSGLRVGSDGTLEGIEESASQNEDQLPLDSEILLSHFIALLETFIGVELTMRLVVDIWSDLSIEGFDLRKKKESP